MHPSNQHKERKFVPRFRRRNANENVVDADDVEAQVLIEKDLQSHFKWTSDLNEEFKYQFDNFDEQYSNQQISLGDQNNEEFLYDIDPNNQQLWNINIEDNDNNHSIKWSENEEQKKMMFSGENLQEKEQQWSLHEMKENFIKFDQNDQSHKYKLDTNNEHQEQIFIQGEQFRHQVKFFRN